MSTQNRRKDPRINHRIQLHVTGDAEITKTESENLSASGVYCAIKHYIPLMTKLKIRLELPTEHGSSIACQGVVVRIEPPVETPKRATYHVAIFFNDLSEQDRTRLAGYVQAHLAPGPASA